MKVLVAEDDSTSLFMLQSLLEKWGFDVVATSDGTEALMILQEDDPPLLAILDWMLPGVSGPEICRRLSSRERPDGWRNGEMGRPYQYILILTVKGEKENVIAGLEAGADDYITKPFDSHELRMRVMAGKRILDLQEQLRNAATYDSLTGLLNRRAVISRLENEIARATRSGTPLGVALLDIDHFKRINDTHGHMYGDAALVESAARIRSVLRSYDISGRYGGEEFLLIFPGLERREMDSVCERIRLSFHSAPFHRVECAECVEEIPITVSIGVCDLSPEFNDVDSILAEADRALYRAKNMGRNVVSR